MKPIYCCQKVKQHQKSGEIYTMFMDWKSHYYENCTFLQININIQHTIVNIQVFFVEIEKLI